MKAYTDIEQSKKLAEILPRESADMRYVRAYFEGKNSDWFIQLGRAIKSDDVIPAWSLAALINALPISVKFKDDEYYLRFMKDYVEYANDEVSLTGVFLHTTGNNNLVDACYEMVVQLKENGLI